MQYFQFTSKQKRLGRSELSQPLFAHPHKLVLQVRSQCLATITKILHFGTADNLGEQLNDLPISSFIAALLAQKDSNIAAKAMQLAEILMHKLPKVFSKYFLKEGVVHAVEQLAATAPKPTVEEKEKLKGKAAKRASQRLKVSVLSNNTSLEKCVPHMYSSL